MGGVLQPLYWAGSPSREGQTVPLSSSSTVLAPDFLKVSCSQSEVQSLKGLIYFSDQLKQGALLSQSLNHTLRLEKPLVTPQGT